MTTTGEKFDNACYCLHRTVSGRIIIANLISFTGGELLYATRWFGLF